MTAVLRTVFFLCVSIFFVFSKDDSLNFQQNEYEPRLERIELISTNPKKVENVKILNFKYNRTTKVINLTATIISDIEDDLQVTVQAYRFASNEYRLFPIRFQVRVCDMIKNNLFGIGTGIKRCGNCTGCPFHKGTTLHVCHFAPDGAKFPPFIPNGKYRADLQFNNGNEKVALIAVFLEIVRPLKV